MNMELEQGELNETAVSGTRDNVPLRHKCSQQLSLDSLPQMPLWALVKFASTTLMLPEGLSDCLIHFLKNAHGQMSFFKSFRPTKHFFSDGGDFEFPCSDLLALIL